jgi:toxin HigB-1
MCLRQVFTDKIIYYFCKVLCKKYPKPLDNSNDLRYYRNVILSFKDKETELVYNEQFSKKLPRDIQRVALRKLIVLHNAVSLEDLRILPGNKLEQLHGDRKRQHSIRINDQWRVCFTWENNNAHDVEIVDYH